MSVSEIGSPPPPPAPVGAIPGVVDLRESPLGPPDESALIRHVGSVFGKAMERHGPAADTFAILRSAASELANFESGHITEDEYRTNIEALASDVTDGMASLFAVAENALKAGSLAAGEKAEAARVQAVLSGEEPEPRSQREEKDSQFAARVADRFLEDGVKAKSVGLFDEIKTLETKYAADGVVTPPKPEKAKRSARGSLMLRAATIPSRALQAVGDFRAVDGVREHLSRHKKLAWGVGVTAVAAAGLIAYMDKTGAVQPHLAAAVQHLPHARGASSDAPQMVGTSQIVHAGEAHVHLASAHPGHLHEEFATGSAPTEDLHYNELQNGGVAVKVNLHQGQTLINGHPVNLSSEHLQDAITANVNGHEVTADVAMHNGVIDIPGGALADAVRSHDVTNQVFAQHGSLREVFTTAPSNEHVFTVNQNVLHSAQHANAHSRGSAGYHRRGGPKYNGRETAAVTARSSDKVAEMAPGVAIIGGVTAWAVGAGTFVDRRERRKGRARAARLGLPPPTYGSRRSRRGRNTRGASAPAAPDHEGPDTSDAPTVHADQVRAVQEEVARVQRSHLEDMAAEAFRLRNNIKPEDKDRLGEEFENAGQARDAILRSFFELDRRDMSSVINVVRAQAARIARLGREGEASALMPPSRGGTLPTYISFIEALARNAVAGQEKRRADGNVVGYVKQSEAFAYGLMVALQMSNGRTVEELYDYLTTTS